MKLKWDGQFKKTKEVNDWSWWALFCVMVIMEVIFVLKVLGKI